MVSAAKGLYGIDAFSGWSAQPEGQVFPDGAIPQIPFFDDVLNHGKASPKG